MTVNELGDFIFENYYERIVFVKEIIYYLMKRLKKIYHCLEPNELNKSLQC